MRTSWGENAQMKGILLRFARLVISSCVSGGMFLPINYYVRFIGAFSALFLSVTFYNAKIVVV
jgi:hypothetical protein